MAWTCWLMINFIDHLVVSFLFSATLLGKTSISEPVVKEQHIYSSLLDGLVTSIRFNPTLKKKNRFTLFLWWPCLLMLSLCARWNSYDSMQPKLRKYSTCRLCASTCVFGVLAVDRPGSNCAFAFSFSSRDLLLDRCNVRVQIQPRLQRTYGETSSEKMWPPSVAYFYYLIAGCFFPFIVLQL
jgi:hypothetical protein